MEKNEPFRQLFEGLQADLQEQKRQTRQLARAAHLLSLGLRERGELTKQALALVADMLEDLQKLRDRLEGVVAAQPKESEQR